MKEFSVTLKDGIAKGLRASDRNQINSEALVTCYNLKPAKGGLESYEPLTNPIVGGQAVDWPFPQMFLGQDVRVLATGTDIYELSTWTKSASKLTVTKSERWEFIDFGPYLVMTNGLKLCIRSFGGTWAASDSLSTMPRFSTGCNFNGQMVVGNIKSTWYDCGVGSVAWGKIGDVNFTLDGSNEAGYRQTPWEGSVLRVKKLGAGIVVYCQNGIGLLRPFEQTFGWDTLQDVGIPAKAAVGGNDNIHVFVDTNGNLCRINSQYEIQVLGYDEYMDDMTPANIVVEHDPILREFHISDATHGFLLTEEGLSNKYQAVTTIVTSAGTQYGVFTDLAVSTAQIIVDTMDFGLRGLKTLQTIEVGGYHASGDLNAFAQWKSSKIGSFTTGPNIIVNPDGVATVIMTGDELRVGLTYASYLGIQLDYLTLRFKLSDKRYVRGKYNAA